jgi:Zn-dependent M28 family amino/carboxypeptidase
MIPAKNESLLVSSHFDSGIESFGATDDGIAVGSMISATYSLSRFACNHTIPYSLIMNFNNGEELGLFGGASFTLHPLYSNVKAFINLEGAGVSEKTPSILFRTNSFSLLSLLMDKAPYPQGSVIANNIMRLLPRYSLCLNQTF